MRWDTDDADDLTQRAYGLTKLLDRAAADLVKLVGGNQGDRDLARLAMTEAFARALDRRAIKLGNELHQAGRSWQDLGDTTGRDATGARRRYDEAAREKQRQDARAAYQRRRAPERP